jgi:hypothetical protein
VPQLDLVALPHPAAPEQAPQNERRGKVEPENRVGALEDEVADDGVVRPVADPAVLLSGRKDAQVQLLLAARLPVRAVPQRVDLDVPRVETFGEERREARLPAAARPDDRDARQSRNSPRATITAEPPTSISVSERAFA